MATRTLTVGLGALFVLTGCAPEDDEQPQVEEQPFEDARGSLPAEQLEGLLSGTLPLQWGFVEGEWRAGWVVGDGREQENLAPEWISEVYVFCHDSEFESCPTEAPKHGENVFATLPVDAAYSPYWQVVRVRVPDDYVDSSIKSEELIFESGWETERLPMVVNCPIHAPGAWLENGTMVRNNLGWYQGWAIEYWDFGLVDMVDGVIPAQEGYALYRDGELLSEVALDEDVNMDGDLGDTNNIFGWASGPSARMEIRRADVDAAAVTTLDVQDATQADFTDIGSLDDGSVTKGESLGFVNFGLQPAP